MNFKKSLVAIALASVIAACGEKNSEEHVAEAQALIKNNEFQSAIIELKNATQADAENAVTRELLADIYFKTGQLEFAEKEYIKALEFGADQESIFPKFAEVLFYKTDYQQVTELELDYDSEEYGPLEKLFFIQALSATNLQDQPEALRFFELAIESNPDSIYGKLSAVLKNIEAEPEVTLAALTSVMQNNPDFALGHLLKGHFENQLNKSELALSSYQTFDSLTPNLLLADIYLSIALVQNAEYEQAIQVASKVTKQHKTQPLANQLLATSYFNLKDFEQSLIFSEVAITNGFDNYQSRVVAGMSAYSLGKLELAYSHFSKIKSQLPKDHFARQAILSTEIQIGKIEELENSVDELDLSLLQPEIVNAASLELFKAGKTEAGKKLLAKSSALDYSDANNLSKLGVLKISTSDMSGIKDLEAAVELEPTSIPLNITLGSAYVQANQLKKASVFAKQFVNAFPDSIESYNYAALVAFKNNDLGLVKTYLDKALSIDPDNKMSLMFYANEYLEGEQYDKSYAAARKVLAKEPSYIPAIRAAVFSAKKLSKHKEILDIFDTGIKTINESDVKLLKAEYHFSKQEYKNVVDVLDIEEANETSPKEFWSLLARSTFFVTGSNETIRVLEKWTQVQPNNTASWSSLISFLERYQLSRKAYSTSQIAYEKFSDSQEFGLTYSYYLSLDGKTAKTQSILKGIKVTDDNKSLYKLVEAQVALKETKYKKALSLADQSYALKPTFNAGRLRYVLTKSLESKEAAWELAETHLKTNSLDNSMRLLLANEYISTNPSKAIEHYELVLAQLPNNITALNNIAYLLSNEGKFEQALIYANKAVALNTSNANTLDTLGMIYFKNGDIKKAHEKLKTAYNLAPTNQSVIKHLKEIEASL
ncbi:PEP-CTERM system TPR-repeat protein PrsT [Psychrosphaera haliotis]|uniref:XrtA/PEP-CTERM system TPR-repeat protein PrsT n=1 Tax=Psychrosphaera haliotis TaxID=555083 RepID=UPI0031D17EDD